MVQKLTVLLMVVAALGGCSDPAVTARPQPPVVSGERIVFTQDSPQLAAFAFDKATVRETETVRLNGRIVWDEERTVALSSTNAASCGLSCVNTMRSPETTGGCGLAVTAGSPQPEKTSGNNTTK